MKQICFEKENRNTPIIFKSHLIFKIQKDHYPYYYPLNNKKQKNVK